MTEIRVLVNREKFRAKGFQRGSGRGHFLRVSAGILSWLSLQILLFLSLSLSLFLPRVSLLIIKVENPNSEHDEKKSFASTSSKLFEKPLCAPPPCALPQTSPSHRRELKKTRHERQQREIARGDAIHLHSRMARAIHEKQLHNGPKRDFHFRGKSARYAHA